MEIEGEGFLSINILCTVMMPLAVTTFLRHFRFRWRTKSSCDKLQNQ